MDLVSLSPTHPFLSPFLLPSPKACYLIRPLAIVDALPTWKTDINAWSASLSFWSLRSANLPGSLVSVYSHVYTHYSLLVTLSLNTYYEWLSLSTDTPDNHWSLFPPHQSSRTIPSSFCSGLGPQLLPYSTVSTDEGSPVCI